GHDDYTRLTNFHEGRVLWPNISYDGREIVFEHNFRIWKLDTESGRADEVPISLRGAPSGTAIEHIRMSDQIQELQLSPDGKLLAFQRGTKELRVLDLSTKQERAIATAALERPPIIADRPFVWSPDSRWIAYMPVGEREFRNVFVVSVNGGASRPASFIANSNSNTISWSPDGTFLLFDTGQRTESNQLARVDLIPRTPKFREA